MEYLFDRLGEYGRGDIYPYHMPGHKRRPWGKLPEEMYLRDITEIDGFDDLHQPKGAFKELQEYAAWLYGAEESFCLVNGSTSGILCAVSAALPEGGHILMARNCHRAAYHAAYLRKLSVTYLYPPLMEEYDIYDGITPLQVEKALEREPDIGAVLIVSPTYEGRISDIRGIVEIVHNKGIPLIIDEAHGAHLGFGQDFAENSCRAGADIVIHSVHKTLPALTQTALLHVNGGRVDRSRIRRYLHIYQSSSPSYLLMAGIDNCLKCLEKEGAGAFAIFAAAYGRLLEELSVCRHLRFLPLEPGRQDIGKLLISTKMTGVSGKWLYDVLLREYHLQLEMAAGSYALAMFTVNDTEEGYERMKSALIEIDASLEVSTEAACPTEAECSAETASPVETVCPVEVCAADALMPAEAYSEGSIPLARAWDMEKCCVDIQDSVDCRVGEFVNLYPPGIPLLVPGEKITSRMVTEIRCYQERGLLLQGLEPDESTGKLRICILKE